jgi:hypothetical protein
VGWFRRGIEDGIEGTAYVSACGGVPPKMKVAINIGSTYRCEMDLVVMLPDREPYPLEVKLDVDPNRPVEPGMTLRVLVDRDDPERIEVDLDAVPSLDERADQALAADLERARQAYRDRPGPQRGQ